MDSAQVKAFCATAAQLLTQVGDYAATDPAQRKPTDDAAVRQLRIAIGGLASALQDVARMTPPPMPPMPAAPTGR
jgi:hypothetical protein